MSPACKGRVSPTAKRPIARSPGADLSRPARSKPHAPAIVGAAATSVAARLASTRFRVRGQALSTCTAWRSTVAADDRQSRTITQATPARPITPAVPETSRPVGPMAGSQVAGITWPEPMIVHAVGESRWQLETTDTPVQFQGFKVRLWNLWVDGPYGQMQDWQGEPAG